MNNNDTNQNIPEFEWRKKSSSLIPKDMNAFSCGCNALSCECNYKLRPGVIAPPPEMCCSGRRGPEFIQGKRQMNHGIHRDKYFYTVLFLDKYYQPLKKQSTMTNTARKSKLIYYDIMADSATAHIKWLDDHTLYVQHNLALPITLEMWDNLNNPIVYAPLLKFDVMNITLGNVKVYDSTSVIFDFSCLKKPEYNEVYRLAIRTLPDLNMVPDDDPSNATLGEIIECLPEIREGLAIVFRRNSLDALYDLISEFDEAYWHTLDENEDLKYLTEKSCYKEVYFQTKYTNNLQDVLDLIDVNSYEVKYSWENNKKDKNHRYF